MGEEREERGQEEEGEGEGELICHKHSRACVVIDKTFWEPTTCIELTTLQNQWYESLQSHIVAFVGAWAIITQLATNNRLITRQNQCVCERKSSFSTKTWISSRTLRPECMLTTVMHMISENHPFISMFSSFVDTLKSLFQPWTWYFSLQHICVWKVPCVWYFALDICNIQDSYFLIHSRNISMHQERRIFQTKEHCAGKKWTDVDNEKNPGEYIIFITSIYKHTHSHCVCRF